MSASLSLDLSPPNIGRASQFTSETLRVWGLDRLAHFASLVVTELVKNAFEHARTAVTVELHNRDGGVRISVRDGSSLTRRRSRQRKGGAPAYGLDLVTHLAADWGVEPTGSGKVVWAFITEDFQVKDTRLWEVALGFPDLTAAAYGGFRVSMIDEYSPEPQGVGRAIVTAPDGSVAWLVWEANVRRRYLRELRPPDDQRWGAWSVGLTLPVTTWHDGRTYFLAAIQELRPRWEAWRQERA